MPRCPDCQKFVSLGDLDIDEIEIALNDTTLTLEGMIYLTCGTCGIHISSAELEADDDVSVHFDRQPDEATGEEAVYEFDDNAHVEATERREDGERAKIDPKRAKKFYGVKATCRVIQKILKNGEPVGDPEEAEIVLEADEQASSFQSET
jgi:hypothetical protein